ncbi:hypothetical protein OPT61_g393 [Boeremia exigua]|uniref:Uncharacterized protein n=1 Tax=Boeremia exigua TaxID=749465 RepID=A0ACC2ITY4_9PLEO|nr:hypothetical protein OPT61_g393 [Boeremia exigua]
MPCCLSSDDSAPKILADLHVSLYAERVISKSAKQPGSTATSPADVFSAPLAAAFDEARDPMLSYDAAGGGWKGNRLCPQQMRIRPLQPESGKRSVLPMLRPNPACRTLYYPRISARGMNTTHGEYDTAGDAPMGAREMLRVKQAALRPARLKQSKQAPKLSQAVKDMLIRDIVSSVKRAGGLGATLIYGTASAELVAAACRVVVESRSLRTLWKGCLKARET